MVEEQDSYLFGTTKLPRRLANLLLIATKRLTGSPARYTQHYITTDSADPAVEAVEAEPSVGSVAPDATNSLATVPFEDLLRIARSSDSTHEAARKEILRREVLCCAVRHILVGRRKVPNKTCSYSGLVEFSSAAKEMRNKTIEEIARFGFSAEDAKTISTALVKILRPGSSATHQSLTELCGLSLDHGPVFMGETEYRALILENEQNVNAIIGNALEAELRSIDPDHWNFDDYSTGTAETSGPAHHECRERRERSEEPEAPGPSVPASKRTRLV
jgi:hypothetical protein